MCQRLLSRWSLGWREILTNSKIWERFLDRLELIKVQATQWKIYNNKWIQTVKISPFTCNQGSIDCWLKTLSSYIDKLLCMTITFQLKTLQIRAMCHHQNNKKFKIIKLWPQVSNKLILSPLKLRNKIKFRNLRLQHKFYQKSKIPS